jgi:hypothetical protein
LNYQAIIENFAEAANRFCSWIESGGAAKDRTGLEASKHLSTLYSLALQLPGVDEEAIRYPPDIGEIDKTRLETSKTLINAFPFQYYREVFHALGVPEDPVLGDICDDLFDIYKDLKEGLAVFSEGDEPLAVWHWGSTFGIHWGRHAVSALKALYDFDPEQT